MTRTSITALTLAAAVVGLNGWSSRPGAAGPAARDDAPGGTIHLPVVCDTPLKPPRVDPDMPADVEGALMQKNFNVVQRAVDIFAWQEFIALNWPAEAGERGEPARKKPFTAPGPRVWETWKETSEVYLPGGNEPPPWGAHEPIPEACQGEPHIKILVRQHKVDEVLHDVFQPTKADGTLPGTLTDQHGRVVRYEIRMNRVLFEYVRNQGLYNAVKQARAAAVHAPNGSVLIKAAWRELGPGEEGRFYTAEAWVSDHPNRSVARYHRCKVGLVGLHVMTKTPSAPQWIWSTFEQVDNVRGAKPSFSNPSCTHCLTNRQTQPGIPNQVTRIIPIPATDPNCAAHGQAVDNVHQLNLAVQKGLGDSPFRDYELVGAQWPVPKPPVAPTPATVFDVFPARLGNTTMETYIQDTSSCMGCHAMARTSNPAQFVSADFSFTFSNARPEQPNTQVIPRPIKPVTAWDTQQWNNILRGHALAARTYELLPANVPVAKLHCGRCHLNNGGNPTAAWWVGMIKQYDYPKTTKLQDRINQCFERSMNGVALPTNATNTTNTTNPDMSALILYMQWLDEQAQALKIPSPATPYPPISGSGGKKARGEVIFGQKCAFCHGADGQGRYESHTYYRPALWGPRSFNASAGMAKTATLAQFIHANMPFQSGGELTDEEAWNLATFIDSQSRPGK